MQNTTITMIFLEPIHITLKVTRMNPGGRFAPQSQLSETAKDGALLRGFGGATLDLGRGWVLSFC